jgi:hypothetical protein
MDDMSHIFKKLSVYKERLEDLERNPGMSLNGFMQSKIWYEKEIDLLEAEIAGENLKVEMDLNTDKPNVVWTDSKETVEMLLKEERVTKLDARWSWRHFRSMFYVEFYYRKRF